MKEFISWVIRQKGESQNGCFKKAKHSKFSEKRTFLTSGMFTYACVSGLRNIRFFRKIWRAFFSWKTRFEIRPFSLLPTIFSKKCTPQCLCFQNAFIKIFVEKFLCRTKKDGWVERCCMSFYKQLNFLSQRQVVHRRY